MNGFPKQTMKWLRVLAFFAVTVSPVHAQDELEFPFDRATRITFIRLGNVEMDAGQQFVLKFEGGEWIVERRISRTQELITTVSQERAEELMLAFADLYEHWQSHPYFDRTAGGYSLFISIKDSWRMALIVKDRGSPALTKLIEAIEYPEGLVLEEGAEAPPTDEEESQQAEGAETP